MASRRIRLAQRRKAAGFTQEGFAEALQVDRSTVVRWEAGDTEPQPWLRPKIATALGLNSDELDALIRDRSGSELVAPDVSQLAAVFAGRPGVQLSDELTTFFGACLAALASTATRAITTDCEKKEHFISCLLRWADMNRREVIHLLGLIARSAATSAVLGIASGINPDEQGRVAGAVAAPKRVDAQVIDHIEQALWIANNQDNRLGPQAALPMVPAQRDLARTMLQDCPERLRPRLLTILGSASLMSGWLSFDHNDFAAAESYYEQARSAAHEAQNTELAAFVLAKISQVATWVGKSTAGMDHAVAAQNLAAKTGNLQLQAVVSDHAANAYAAAGHYAECSRELEHIQRCLSASSSTPLHIPGYYDPASSDGYLYWGRGSDVCKSVCMLALGKPQEAAASASVSLKPLESLDLSSVRDRAFCTLVIGKAHVQAKEIDEAAKVIAAAADLATQNRSPRLVKELRMARTAVRPWQNTYAVKELDEQLQGYGLMPGSYT